MSANLTMLTDDVISPQPKKSRSKIALLGLSVTGGLAVGLTVITASFVSPALRRICLPYVPATPKQVSNVLKLCKKNVNGGGSLVDLGSGDGRIVHTAAKHGYHATGYELNTWLVVYSKIYSRFNGLKSQTHFERKDLWKVDLRRFDNIVIFGVADMMDELSVKLETEMHDGTNVLACRFPIEHWTPQEVIEAGIDSVWLYNKQSIPASNVKVNKLNEKQ